MCSSFSESHKDLVNFHASSTYSSQTMHTHKQSANVSENRSSQEVVSMRFIDFSSNTDLTHFIQITKGTLWWNKKEQINTKFNKLIILKFKLAWCLKIRLRMCNLKILGSTISRVNILANVWETVFRHMRKPYLGYWKAHTQTRLQVYKIFSSSKQPKSLDLSYETDLDYFYFSKTKKSRSDL